jgi:sugar phosphate isomerase/epimerase
MRNPVTFSTLACPGRTAEAVIGLAAACGYDGIEWRGGPHGHLRPELPAGRREEIRQRVAEAGLCSAGITAYTSFTSADRGDLQANVDDLRRYLDLAAEMQAGFVRAFLGELYPGADVEQIRRNAAECLLAAAGHAAALGVAIAVEPHDEFVRTAEAAPILAAAAHPAIGAVWDIGNAYSAGEDPAESFQNLAGRIRHVHVKDGIGRSHDWRLTPLGQGEVPLACALALLLAAGYEGALSFEWEWAWHPELDPPEVELPRALPLLKRLLMEAGSLARRSQAQP